MNAVPCTEFMCRNAEIDRWIALADAPEVRKHFVSPEMIKAADGRSDRLDQIRRDVRHTWINCVFWQKALLPGSARKQFPRLGIYEILCEHHRVFDMQGTPLDAKQFDGILKHGFATCADAIASQVQAFFASIGKEKAVAAHPLFDEFRNAWLELAIAKDEPTRGNLLFFLDWSSIQLGQEILIPYPEHCVVVENFSV